MNEDDSPSDPRMKRIQKFSRWFRILCGLAFLFCSLLALASLFAPLSNTGKMNFRIGTPEAAGTQQTAGKDPDGANTKNKTIRVRFSVHAGGEEDQAATPAI